MPLATARDSEFASAATPGAPSPPSPPSPPVAELRGVTKRYGSVLALDRLDLALAPGRVTALLGPNGAGKTTAVKLLLGLAQPDSGTVLLFGGSPRAAANRQRVGVMLQVAKVPETLTVREHLHLFSSYYPAPLPPAELIAAAGLAGLEDRRFGELSGGQRQRVLFALALCGDPALLFLDEPTVGLDVESRRAFWSQIRRLAAAGRSILLTTHYLEEADALADRIVVLHHGTVIADGSPAAIKARAAGSQIRCATVIGAEQAAGIAGVQSAERDKGELVLLVSEPEKVISALLALDPALRDLEIRGAALEDAFLALTAEPIAAAAAAASHGEPR